jgi:hypothetical protein
MPAELLAPEADELLVPDAAGAFPARLTPKVGPADTRPCPVAGTLPTFVTTVRFTNPDAERSYTGRELTGCIGCTVNPAILTTVVLSRAGKVPDMGMGRRFTAISPPPATRTGLRGRIGGRYPPKPTPILGPM